MNEGADINQKTGAQGRGRPRLNPTRAPANSGCNGSGFFEKGYGRANTSEIARRAKTSKQTLYSLFPTKADLFVGVIGCTRIACLKAH